MNKATSNKLNDLIYKISNLILRINFDTECKTNFEILGKQKAIRIIIECSKNKNSYNSINTDGEINEHLIDIDVTKNKYRYLVYRDLKKLILELMEIYNKNKIVI
jgi:hypothetical protein